MALAVVLSGCGVASRAQDAGDGTATGAGGNPTTGPVGPIPAGLEKYYQQKPEWERCGRNQECTHILVPLDYTKPDGQTIELVARKVLARDQAGKLGTLFINPGGPGGSGEQFAASAGFVLGSSLLRKYDVIGWDPRGVGGSTPVKCLDTGDLDKFIATDGSPDNQAEITALDTEAKTLADGCEQRSGRLLAHVSTRDAARDLDVLRGIVGDQQLNYLGFSYGTFLGATYAELFPKNAGRMVLDGAVDPSKTAEENNIAQAKGFDTALEAFAADCAQRNCRLGNTKAAVLAQVDKLINDSDANPLPGDGKREVTQAIVVTGVISSLYRKDFWPQLEDAVLDGLDGNGARLLALVDRMTDRDVTGYVSNANEVIYAVNCVDRPDLTSVAQAESEQATYEAASPRFGASLLWGSLPCAHWPVKPEDKPHVIKAAGAKPIVVIGTTRDPATPYAWAVGLAHQLESGVLITRDGDGHTGYKAGNACVDNAVETFLLQGKAPAADIKC